MKRYDLFKAIEWGYGDAWMEEDNNGDYVKWEDVREKLQNIIDNSFDVQEAHYKILKQFEL